jgi:hypothetical protein
MAAPFSIPSISYGNTARRKKLIAQKQKLWYNKSMMKQLTLSAISDELCNWYNEMRQKWQRKMYHLGAECDKLV